MVFLVCHSAAGEESPIFVSLKQSDPSAFGLRMTKNYLMVSFWASAKNLMFSF